MPFPQVDGDASVSVEGASLLLDPSPLPAIPESASPSGEEPSGGPEQSPGVEQSVGSGRYALTQRARKHVESKLHGTSRQSFDIAIGISSDVWGTKRSLRL